MDYNAQAREIEASNEQSAIAEFQSSKPYIVKKDSIYMADTPEEVARRFKEHAQMQEAQNEMTRAQQEFINNLK